MPVAPFFESATLYLAARLAVHHPQGGNRGPCPQGKGSGHAGDGITQGRVESAIRITVLFPARFTAARRGLPGAVGKAPCTVNPLRDLTRIRLAWLRGGAAGVPMNKRFENIENLVLLTAGKLGNGLEELASAASRSLEPFGFGLAEQFLDRHAQSLGDGG